MEDDADRGEGGGPRARVRRAAVTAALLAGGLGLAADALPAQPVPPVPVLANADAFAPLDFPPPGPTRSVSGEPGERYWQQRVDYRIRATLDPRRHRIAGFETIAYTNHSPDTLRTLWLQLDQNLFRPGSPEAEAVPEGSRFAGAFGGGGFDLESVAVSHGGPFAEAGALAPDEAGAGPPGDGPAYRVRGTVMELRLAEPVPPAGGRVDLRIRFAFTVPERGADRMGRLDVRRGTVYQIAQWYPRLFVYDDLNGWNALPYLGQGEFYLEYGDFDVELTLPREFVVVATGVLRNPEEVFAEPQLRRLEEARASDGTVSIIERGEAGRRSSRPPGEGPLTWRFRAEGVRDFAWAASEAFLLDGGSWNDVLLLSAYPEEGLGEFGPGWDRSTEILRHSLRHYSERWHPYPYPVAINVAGPVLGMEYPMLAFCTVEARGRGLFAVTDHEVAHNWFPMLVGSDERRHAWMDEGFVQFMGVYSEEAFYGEASPGNPVNPEGVARQMGSEAATEPILTQPDRLSEEQIGFLAYLKPAAALVLLRDYVLGAERFDPAFRAYIERWREKHASPADFVRTLEHVTGEDLDWFFRGWFLSTGRLDQAIAEVAREGESTTVRIENRGEVVMPVEVRLIYADGGDECRRIPARAWLFGESITLRVHGRDLRNVQLDPRGALPDANAANDVWGRGVVIRRERC